LKIYLLTGLGVMQDLRQLRENASKTESAELERLRRELQAAKDSAARCPIY
jgi:cell division protein ZapA (FtsZ GTPase activity inhibitor)